MNIRTWLLFLTLTIVASSHQFWDYTYSTTLNCTKKPELDDQTLWTTLRLHTLDRYSFIIVSPIILILMIIALTTYCIKDSRSTPSDIILALTICEILVIGPIFIQSAYETSYKTTILPRGFMSLCNTLSVFVLIGWIGLNYYNMIFCFVLSHSIRNTLKGAFLTRKKYHIVGIIIMGVFPLIIYLTNGIGRSVNSICSIKYSDAAPFVIMIAPIVLIIIAVVSVYRFKTGIPNNSFFRDQSVYSFYFIYIFIVIIFQLLISILGLVGELNCRSDEPVPALEVCFSISNIVTLAHPILIVFLRYHHPAVKYKIKTIIQSFKKKDQDESFNRAMSGDGDEIQMQNFNWLGSLLQSIRGSQVFSFLTGMLITHIQFKNQPIGSTKNIDFFSHYVFHLDEFSADTYLQKRVNLRDSKKVKVQLGGIKPLDYEVTSFCPRVFRHLVHNMENINLQNSLSIVLNRQIIKKVATVDGGKSGEFFFCSHDFNILFKTISEAEAMVFLSNIDQFEKYYREEQNSLISKIIGLYRFTRTDIVDSSVYIILQKNLSMCDRTHIDRVFDLKGSKYNRQTLKQKKVKDLTTVTLKDIDFFKTEQKIRVSATSAKHIKRILASDIAFLQRIKVMDYSLLVMKVNWDQAAFFKNIKNTESIIPKGNNRFQITISQTQKGVYYHFTIIDYLQTWNTAKQAQNIFKKVIVREFQESVVTVQEPALYASRLTKFIQTIF